uniref:Uncharacterized protein n=1 Tax=Salix viminalis TaxID=40686 RepID=A0A6N2MDI3_SALVM
MIDDIMFDNSFAYYYRFDNFERNDNEDDDMLDPNIIININDEIISHVLEFGDIFWFGFFISHDWILNHRCMLEGYDLVAEKIFGSKNELVLCYDDGHEYGNMITNLSKSFSHIELPKNRDRSRDHIAMLFDYGHYVLQFNTRIESSVVKEFRQAIKLNGKT